MTTSPRCICDSVLSTPSAHPGSTRTAANCTVTDREGVRVCVCVSAHVSEYVPALETKRVSEQTGVLVSQRECVRAHRCDCEL
jgi:hypothetical protein